MSDEKGSVEIGGPFKERPLVIDGYNVPGITAHEVDGGEFWLVVDHRMAVTVDAQHFEKVARFVADVIGHCWGYGSHPRDEVDDPATHFARVPHPALAPHRVSEIVGANVEDSDEDAEEREAQ